MSKLLNRPPVDIIKDVRMDFPQSTALTCGAPMWVVNGGEEQICRVSVFIEGGTCQESMPMQALLTAMMTLEGSDNFSPTDVAERIDYHGAQMAAQGHDNMCELTFSSVNECYDEIMDILRGALCCPLFPNDEFEVTQRRIASSCMTMRQQVRYLADAELRRLYYGDGHPLALDVKPEDVMRLKTDDLRQFYNSHYSPTRSKVILSGKVNDDMVRTVNDMMYNWALQNPECGPLATEPPALDSRPGLSVVDKPGAVQAAIAIAIPAVGRSDADYLKLRVLCMALGGYFGSRLMSNVREDKGYTYGISAFLSGKSNEGHIGINTECATGYVWKVIEEIKAEMQRLCDVPLPEDELERVRLHMMSDLAKQLDTPFARAKYVSSTFLYGVYPDYFNCQVNTIMTVTPVELQQVACRYLDVNKMIVAIAGDKSSL